MQSPNIPSPMFHQQNCRRGKGLWVKKGEALFFFFQTCVFQTLRLKHITSVLELLESHLGPLPWQQRPETPASSVAPNRLHGWSCGVASADTAGSPSELSLQSPSPNLSGKIIKTVVQASSQKSTKEYVFFCRKIPAWAHRFPSLYFWAPGRIHKDKSTWGCGES